MASDGVYGVHEGNSRQGNRKWRADLVECVAHPLFFLGAESACWSFFSRAEEAWADLTWRSLHTDYSHQRCAAMCLPRPIFEQEGGGGGVVLFLAFGCATEGRYRVVVVVGIEQRTV